VYLGEPPDAAFNFWKSNVISGGSKVTPRGVAIFDLSRIVRASKKRTAAVIGRVLDSITVSEFNSVGDLEPRTLVNF